MTKKLEEEFNLPPIEDISLFGEEAVPIEAGESTIETSKQDIALTQNTLEVTQRIDSALPIVQGLEQLDREMDE